MTVGVLGPDFWISGCLSVVSLHVAVAGGVRRVGSLGVGGLLVGALPVDGL